MRVLRSLGGTPRMTVSLASTLPRFVQPKTPAQGCGGGYGMLAVVAWKYNSLDPEFASEELPPDKEFLPSRVSVSARCAGRLWCTGHWSTGVFLE